MTEKLTHIQVDDGKKVNSIVLGTSLPDRISTFLASWKPDTYLTTPALAQKMGECCRSLANMGTNPKLAKCRVKYGQKTLWGHPDAIKKLAHEIR